MGVGNAVPYMGWGSQLGIAEESTWGTFVTATALIEFNTESLKMAREEKLLESINSTRHIKKRLTGNETVDGSVEAFLNVASDGLMYILKNAFGGTVSSATITVAGNYLHTFYTGDMESNKGTSTAGNIKGLSFTVKRGSVDSWLYFGCRVNNLTIKGEIGNPVIMTAELIGQTASITTTIPTLSLSDVLPVNFTGITIATGATISAASTTEYFTSFEFTLQNNLANDVRSLGSRVISQLPPQRQTAKLKLGMRYDTLTAYARFNENTATAISILLDTGKTITAAGTTYAMIINIPEVYVNSTNPQVGGPGVLMYDLDLTPIFSSAASYFIQAQVRNATANY